ncbi:hypothetical protein SLS58_008499 [Diplodia intermedia]|uniref:Uncharacterized protein n=1 Tax=Diplodia intermedia TaxID=856260 RepID=A0ABR3THB6_9PEZI
MKFATTIATAIGLIGSTALATMSPANLQDTGNSLARQAFDIKDLVLAINSTMNAGPMQDVFEEIDDMYEAVLANIQLIIGTSTLTEESQDVQLVYEAYSYLAQAMFELMDGLGGSASNFITMDNQNEFRVPASVREVGGVVDAWMFNMIGLFPANSSYADEAANQKNQVDTHFRRAIAAYHLATAKTDSPYGNITNIVSTDALIMGSSTSSGIKSTSSDDAKTSDNVSTSNDIRTTSASNNGDVSTNGSSGDEASSNIANSDGISSYKDISNNEDASTDGSSSNKASTDGSSSNKASSNTAYSDGISSNKDTSNNVDTNGEAKESDCAEEGPTEPARK